MRSLKLPIDRNLLFRLRAKTSEGDLGDFLDLVVPIWIQQTREDGYNPARPWTRVSVSEDLYKAAMDSRIGGPKAYSNLNGLLDRIDRVVRRGRRSDASTIGLQDVVEVLQGKGDVEIRIRLSSLLVD